MARILRIALVVSVFMCWMTFWYNSVAAQEYLPPKNGKKPQTEPTMPANYNYSYDVSDNSVSLDFGHNEKRKDDRATGSYHVLLPDGRTQLVEYEAGPDGYKPVVMYMGTATYPQMSDKFDGYHYNAAASRQLLRQASRTDRVDRGADRGAERGIDRGTARQPAAVAPAPATPVAPTPKILNTTKTS